MCQHSIAEVYAALTRLPVQPRIHPVEAARILTENIDDLHIIAQNLLEVNQGIVFAAEA